jgi:Ca-activated chloride channel family protein
MRQPWIICALLVLTLFAAARRTGAQTDAAAAQNAARYNLSVAVDEVSLTFHAADAHGLPINDLKLDQLRILDNGKPPRRILAFQSLQDFPIRAGILLDTSESVEGYLPRNRAISIEYAQQLLRQQTDQAFVMDFNFLSEIVQPWTSNAAALIAGIRKFATYGHGRIGGTAIFTAIYQACLNQFDKIDHSASGNFILLFSDGEDNASHAYLKQAVDMCQRTNTAIYAFRVESPYSSSSGPRTLAELASETGGRVFFDDDSDAGIYNDLRTIEADLRNQYRLVYKPEELRHDGSFHRIELQAPGRADSIVVRSGYYAPGPIYKLSPEGMAESSPGR